MAQIDIKPALSHFAMSLSMTAAVQEVHQIIDLDPDMSLDNPVVEAQLSKMSKIERAQFVIDGLFGVKLEFKNYDEALLTAQALVEHACKTGGVVEDVDLAVMHAKKRTSDFIAKPENKFLLALTYLNVGGSSAPTITEKRDVGGVEQEVAVNAKGEFKKGEKGRLAKELYKKFMATDPEAADPEKANQKFINILKTELGMSHAGATTYNYNMKKEFGGTIVAKPKRA